MAKSLDSDTLYVFTDSALRNFSKTYRNKNDLWGILNNVMLLSLYLLPCGKYDLVGIEIRQNK